MRPNPDLIVLPSDAYAAKLHASYDMSTVWYYHYFGILPRAFLTPDDSAIVVLEGNEKNVRLLLHEYGHAMGLQFPGGRVHPLPSDWRYYLDISGVVPIRITDSFGVRAAAAQWLAKHEL